MSTSNKYLSLFPMEVEVTEEMIEEGTKHLEDCYKCIGALTLAKGLGDNKDLLPTGWGGPSWGISQSKYKTKVGDVGDVYFFTSHDSDGKRVNMMEITEPCTITLKFQFYDKTKS